MTGADLLTRMQVIDNELEIAANGDDEVRALAALDIAQDYFEDVAASMPRIGQTDGTVVTAQGVEYTAWPSELLRVDSVWFVDPNTSRPSYPLDLISDVGGHQPGGAFPFNLLSSSSPGRPDAYAYDSAKFYWRPLPDAVHTLRVYGLRSRTALTSRAITFGWPDSVSLPLAAFAVKLLEMGIDDPSEELDALAEKAFVPILRRMRKSVRQSPMSRHYSRTHST